MLLVVRGPVHHDLVDKKDVTHLPFLVATGPSSEPIFELPAFFAAVLRNHPITVGYLITLGKDGYKR